MTITAGSSLTDVAFAVCSALDRVGTRAVLTGGSAATVYAPEAYQSRDLDFVVFAGDPGPEAVGALEGVGFSRRGDSYAHDKNPLILEFPPGPLAIGNQLVSDHATLERDNEVLHILSPTDCCKDRLAWFFHYSDRSSLEQALAVAIAQQADLDVEEISRWAAEEGSTSRFEEFRRELERRSGP